MNYSTITRQWIDFQKTTVANSFDTLVLLQDCAEKIARMIFDQANWLPDENRRFIDQNIEIFKIGRSELRAAIDKNFDKTSELLSQA